MSKNDRSNSSGVSFVVSCFLVLTRVSTKDPAERKIMNIFILITNIYFNEYLPEDKTTWFKLTRGLNYWLHVYKNTHENPTLMYVNAVTVWNITYFPCKYVSELQSTVLVCVCVFVWKVHVKNLVFAINLTIKKSLKLTKGIKWWHNNIVLKSEKNNIKFR